MKDPIEVQPPSSNRFFIVLCMIASRDRIPFTPFDDVPLDLGRGPDWELGEEIRLAYASLIRLTSSISQSLRGRSD